MDTIDRAIKTMGSARALARSIGVSSQAVSLWKLGRTQMLARHAAAIEDATDGLVTAYDIGRECLERHE